MQPVKPAVDPPVFFNWPSIPDWPHTAISNNGQFIIYAARNIPAGMRRFIVQALHGNKKIVLQQMKKAVFTTDNRYAIVLHSGDSLCLLTLSDLTM